MKKIFVSVLVLTMCSVAYGEDIYNAAPVDNTYVVPHVVPKVNWGKVKYITERIRINNGGKSEHSCEGYWLSSSQCLALSNMHESKRKTSGNNYDNVMKTNLEEGQRSSRQLQRVEEYYYSNNIFYNPKPKKWSSCKGRYNVIPENQKYPLGSPIDLRKIKGETKGLKNHSKGLFADGYRCRAKGPHDGVDIGCHKNYLNTPVYSTADGIVVYAGKHPDKKAAGIYVAIQHQDGYFTKYKHLNGTNVRVGDWVRAGCPIGFLGTTGGAQHSPGSQINKNNAHLHYEIYFEGKKVPDKLSKIEHKRYCYDSASKKKLDNCSGTKFETLDPRPFVMAHGNIPLN